jgi:hypothetical protein
MTYRQMHRETRKPVGCTMASSPCETIENQSDVHWFRIPREIIGKNNQSDMDMYIGFLHVPGETIGNQSGMYTVFLSPGKR